MEAEGAILPTYLNQGLNWGKQIYIISLHYDSIPLSGSMRRIQKFWKKPFLVNSLYISNSLNKDIFHCKVMGWY